MKTPTKKEDGIYIDPSLRIDVTGGNGSEEAKRFIVEFIKEHPHTPWVISPFGTFQMEHTITNRVVEKNGKKITPLSIETSKRFSKTTNFNWQDYEVFYSIDTNTRNLLPNQWFSVGILLKWEIWEKPEKTLDIRRQIC